MPAVSGVTVNRVTGSENSKLSILNKFDADVETMEGYGFFFACLLCKVPFVSLRGISNRVGRRDRQSWKMKEALEQVGLTLNHYLSNLHP
jgi:futalosine hydrolase